MLAPTTTAVLVVMTFDPPRPAPVTLLPRGDRVAKS